MKWVKLGRDDYRSVCGRWRIARLPASENCYNIHDEWILSDGNDGVDVYVRLKDAKAAAEEFARLGWEIERNPTA